MLHHVAQSIQHLHRKKCRIHHQWVKVNKNQFSNYFKKKKIKQNFKRYFSVGMGMAGTAQDMAQQWNPSG